MYLFQNMCLQHGHLKFGFRPQNPVVFDRRRVFGEWAEQRGSSRNSRYF